MTDVRSATNDVGKITFSETDKDTYAFKVSHLSGSCPNCGYCPHCGRGGGWYPQPWTWPYNPLPWSPWQGPYYVTNTEINS